MPDGFLGLFGYGGALEEQRVDTLLQLAHAPVLNAANFEVEVALEWVVDLDEEPKVRPAQLRTQCVRNLGVRENLSNAHAVAQLTLTPPLAKISRQLARQRCHHLLAVVSSLPLQEFGAEEDNQGGTGQAERATRSISTTRHIWRRCGS